MLHLVLDSAYISKDGTALSINNQSDLTAATNLLKGNGTFIIKKGKNVDEITIYFQKGNNIDIVRDAGYTTGNGYVNYTDSDKDNSYTINSSKDARTRFEHDMREDASPEQQSGVNKLINLFNANTAKPITLQEAEITLLQMSKSHALTGAYMQDRLAQLDNKETRTPQEEKERSALARVIFDKAAAISIDRGAIFGTLTTAELAADLKRLNNGAI